MAASNRPTVGEVAATMEVIEQRVEEILGSLDDLRTTRVTESERIWTALGSLSGLDGIAVGMAEIGELLSPLRRLVPPSTALPLEPGVAAALTTIRLALGARRETNFSQVATDWDGPVGVIGAADASLDPQDPYHRPYPYPERES